jgi:pyroglutamyl-peptidase
MPQGNPVPVLLTGFEPFNEWDVNSSWEAARLVEQAMPGVVQAWLLPVDYFAARERLHVLLEELRPAVCLCTGLTPHEHFAVETRARKPEQFAGLDGADENPGAWPWEEMHSDLLALGVPAVCSEEAGRYVCESTYWALLEFRRRHRFPEEAAFLHVPPLSDRFPVERVAAAVLAVIRARLSRRSAAAPPSQTS